MLVVDADRHDREAERRELPPERTGADGERRTGHGVAEHDGEAASPGTREVEQLAGRLGGEASLGRHHHDRLPGLAADTAGAQLAGAHAADRGRGGPQRDGGQVECVLEIRRLLGVRVAEVHRRVEPVGHQPQGLRHR